MAALSRSDLRGQIRRASVDLSALGLDFVDVEVPTGAIDGVNAAYTLAHAPVSSSLLLFKNGVLQRAVGVDYTLVGSTITYIAAAILQVGDTHVCSYRY